MSESTDEIDGNISGTRRKRFNSNSNIMEETANQHNQPAYNSYDQCKKYYNVSHLNRGMAIIFNHEIFDDKNLDPRKGTNLDRDTLCDTLSKLQFLVKVFNNYRVAQIKKEIERISKADHTNNDCLLIVILSHGIFRYIDAKNGKYKFDSIWQKFTSDKCPSLAGKPKLFFVQACQGDKTDLGTVLKSRLETDNNENIETSRFSDMIPTQMHPDFLIAFSTIPGFYSWRNQANGSWFIQSLCKELNKNGLTCDILTLLTFVIQTVAYDFESYVIKNPKLDQRKQIPCVMTMLTRLLRFHEK